MAHTLPRALSHARALRKHETSAEALLWFKLRGRRLNGYKFVRQLPVGRFIVDFACREKKLVVEVDGATHGDVAYDEMRSAILRRDGWRILRVWNEAVFTNLNGVCDTILLELEDGTR